MSTATGTAPDAATVVAPGTGAGSRRWRPGSRALIGAAFVAAVLVVVLLGARAPSTSDPLDPDNPSPSGSQALARVLADQGVGVEVARSADALEAALSPGDPGRTTVVVTGGVLLGPGTAGRLVDSAAAAGADLVVVEPSAGLLDLLSVDAAPRTATPSGPVAAGCRGEGGPALDGLRVEAALALSYPTTSGCFRAEDGWLLAYPREDLALLGAGDVLANDRVLDADNAAVALRLLGAREHLVWYVPDAADLGADDGVALRTLLPDAVLPGLGLLGAAGVALVWWRARRLGPLAVEPMPVTVRAVETTESRGRLYRRAGARGHAAATLRAAALAEASRTLRLEVAPSGAGFAALVRECARRTLQSPATVVALLRPDAPPPADDAELVRLARDLDDLTARLAHDPAPRPEDASHDDR